MILNWKTLREEAPMTVQLIEIESKFTYDPAYHSLLNQFKREITSIEIERFFDDQGWYMTVYPGEFPGWIGVISDTAGNQIYNDPTSFEECRSRGHAKSLITVIAIKSMEEYLKQWIKDLIEGKNHGKHFKTTVLDTAFHVNDNSALLELSNLKYENLNQSGQEEVYLNEYVFLKNREGKAKVLKTPGNKITFPFLDMIVTV